MKRQIGLLLFAITFMFNLNYLQADCKDAQNDALKVKAKIVKINNDEELNIRVDVTNLTENIYLTVVNNYNDNVRTFYYKDLNEDGAISFYTDWVFSKIDYSIRVYSVDKSCSNDYLNIVNVTTPAFNAFAKMQACLDNKDLEMCDPFYDSSEITHEEFVEKVNKEVEEVNKTFGDKVIDFIKSYYLYVLIPFVIIVGIYVTRIIILKKERGKKNA